MTRRDGPTLQALAVEPLGDGRFEVPCGGSCGGTGAHVVAISPDVATCDCGDYQFRRHLRAVLDYLVLAPLEPAIAAAAGPGLERDVPTPDLPPAEDLA